LGRFGRPFAHLATMGGPAVVAQQTDDNGMMMMMMVMGV
jgi:hypothetical protein